MKELNADSTLQEILQDMDERGISIRNMRATAQDGYSGIIWIVLGEEAENFNQLCTNWASSTSTSRRED